jgi:hypothetical protein
MGTSIECLLAILRENMLRAEQSDDFHDGVSLTKTFVRAAKFAEQAETRDFFLGERSLVPDHGWCAGVVMILDAAEVARACRISPVLWDGVKSEREIRTHGPLTGLADAIIGLAFTDRDLDHYRLLGQNSEIELVSGEIEALYKHPKRVSVRNFPPAQSYDVVPSPANPHCAVKARGGGAFYRLPGSFLPRSEAELLLDFLDGQFLLDGCFTNYTKWPELLTAIQPFRENGSKDDDHGILPSVSGGP